MPFSGHEGYLESSCNHDHQVQVWGAEQINVWLNWESFTSIEIFPANKRYQVEAAVAYAVRQWQNQMPYGPVLHYRGITTESEPSSSDLIVVAQLYGPSTGDLVSALAEFISPNIHDFGCDYNTGAIDRGIIRFYKYRPGMLRNDWETATFISNDRYSFGSVLMHEIGHALGIAHTCDGGLNGDLLDSCDPWDKTNPNHGVMCAYSSTLWYQHAALIRGPYSLEVALVRDLYREARSGEITYSAIIQHTSYNGGDSWSYNTSTQVHFKSVTPLGFAANRNYPWGTLAYQSSADGDRLYTMRCNGTNWDNVENPSGVKSILGPSLAIDPDSASLGTMPTGVSFIYSYGQGVISPGNRRWIDYLHSPSGGAEGSWIYHYGYDQSYVRPGIGIAKANDGIKYFVVAYLQRQQTSYFNSQGIAVEIISLNGNVYYPVTYLTKTYLEPEIPYEYPLGDIQVSCGRNGYAEDECTIAYISDGGGSAMQSQNTEFLPFAIHGKIDASFEPKWVTLFSEKPIDNNVVTGIGSVANYTDAYGQLHYLWAQAQRSPYYSSFAAEPEYRRWSPYFNVWTEPFEFDQIDSGNAYTLSEFFYDPQWNHQRRLVIWALRQY